MKRVFQSRRELIAYIAFGAITIAVGLREMFCKKEG